ncbi:DUF1232 domain-containing protein [Lentzea tibetensis]|uniref:DUF1232 domain-containing protein n=1 Tax=Lentzea tibetensis TaxID=2591470 RepID=A0A563EGU3_9PSEU|nr:YkvA family protein [Lentzea tibetensis]TWP45603.1 DUF1232 domain-containing protein [Lentzea tibetensis]
MVVFGAVLAALGLTTLLARDAAVAGMSPALVGWVLLGLGAVSAAIGLYRNRRRKLRGEPHPIGNPIQRIKALPRLIRAMRNGQYSELPKSRLALWAISLVYLVSPIDFIPELLPIIGVTDDAGVLVWLLTTASGASGRYLLWEKKHRDTPGEPS